MKTYHLVRQFVLVAIATVLSFGVNACKSEESGLSVEKTTAQTAQNLEYGSIIVQARSEYLIVPVGVSAPSYRSSDKFSTNSALSSDGTLLVTNLIFYSNNNSSSHLLLDKKAIISQFDYLSDRQVDTGQYTEKFNEPVEEEESDRYLPEYLIYKIVESDTNGDEKRDLDDAELGYLSTLSGKNLQLITPKDTKLIQWEYEPTNQRIILSVREDSNQDKQFDSSDAIAGYVYNLKSKTLQKFTPAKTQLRDWYFDRKKNTILMKLKQDSNQDNKFSEEDESQLVKVNLNKLETKTDMIDQKTKDKIKSLQ
jgi:hypothetical protein